MSFLHRENLLSPRALWTVAVFACASQAALITIIVALAARAAQPDESMYRVVLAASFTEILALPACIASTYLRQRRTAHRTQLILGVLFVLLAGTAAILTMYTLGWVWNNATQDTGAKSAAKTMAMAEAGFAVWSIVIVLQTVLYVMLLWPERSTRTFTSTDDFRNALSPSQMAKTPMSQQSSFRPNTRDESEPVSSAFSAFSTSPRSSLRDSVSKAIRPVTSRTKNLFRYSFGSPDFLTTGSGRVTPTEDAEQNENFGNWSDGSAFMNVNGALFRPIFNRRKLETIPGSRPASLGDPLSAAMPVYSHAALISPLAPSSPLIPSMSATASETSLLTVPRAQSRRQSESDESHIHPLFRSESAIPPPLASPGTVITASPYAGQVVNAEHHVFGPQRWHSARGHVAESATGNPRRLTRQYSF